MNDLTSSSEAEGASMRRNEGGDPVDADALYAVLSETARHFLFGAMRRRGTDTADLANECFLRLLRMPGSARLDRPRFVALASTVIRNLLVDEARRNRRLKNGGHLERISFADVELVADAPEVDVLDLDAALTKLSALDERQGRIVQLKFFAGLTGDEIAEHLGLTRRTVTQEWSMARAWLHRELVGKNG